MINRSFYDEDLLLWLDSSSSEEYDSQSFGIVKMNYQGIVTDYNDAETKIAGLSKEQVLGKHFFTQVAPCTNNFMVAEKYSNDSLDEILPYVFTYITKPTKVEIRLIKGNGGAQYLLAHNA